MSGGDDWRSKPESFWREKLTPEQFQILRKKGTERAFSGAYHATKDAGTYVCAGCGEALFEAAGAEVEAGQERDAVAFLDPSVFEGAGEAVDPVVELSIGITAVLVHHRCLFGIDESAPVQERHGRQVVERDSRLHGLLR